MTFSNEWSFASDHPFHEKKLIALDYGDKFIGVATFHVARDPYPLTHGRIKNNGPEQVLRELKQIISDEMVDYIVVGIPFFTDGKASARTELCRQFAKQVHEQLSIPVYEQDETLSTFEAEERMKKSPRWNFQVNLSEIDAVAASVILEDFLRRSRNNFPL